MAPNIEPVFAFTQNDEVDLATFPQQSGKDPIQLQIPNHQIDLPVIPSSIINGEWQVTTKGVSLLSSNIDSTNRGLILFGHDWPILLGQMRQAKIGETFFLEYRDGSQEKYLITSVFSVTPNQLDVLDLAKQHTVLIYTCSGFMDNTRFVVLGQLQE